MKTFVIIDAHALIHRSFHALPPLNTPAGKPISAVFGTARIILKLIKDLGPSYIAACFDLAKPTFRHKEFQDYKAQREKAHNDLISQFEPAKELFKSFGITCFEEEGFEADDLIGSLVKKFKVEIKNKKLDKIIIATGDLDTLQLVEDEKIVVYTFKKSIQETVVYGEKEVFQRYEISPDQMNDLKGLKGDPSDNIPGVAGIGEKGAIKLVKKFGSLENLYKEIKKPDFKTDKEISERIKNKLIEQEEQAFFSKYLATIETNIKIKPKLKDLEFSEIKKEKIIPLLKEFGFNSLISQIESEKSSQSSLLRAKKSPLSPLFQRGEEKEHPQFSPADNRKEKSGEYFLPENGQEICLYWDKEKNALEILWQEKLFNINLNEVSRGGYAGESNDSIKHPNNIKILKPILENQDILKIGFDLKDLVKFFLDLDIFVRGIYWDIKIASWVLESDVKKYSLEKIAAKYGLKKEENLNQTALIREIKKIQEKKIKNLGLEKVFSQIEIPLISVLAQMERRGIKIDKDKFEKLSQEIEKEIIELEEEIYKLSKKKFNISSPKQLSEILFKELGISPKGMKKTPGGTVSTQESELKKLKKAHPIIGPVIKHRELSKLKNTYIDSLPEDIDKKTGRIHTTYNQAGTATGRLSSENPNLQNLPSQGEWAKKIKSGFIAGKEKKFLSLDYSQIELRIAASLSNDSKMIKAFRERKDIHSLTAAEINNVSLENITSKMRRDAKILNFGILYGMGARAFSQSAGVPLERAKMFIKEYYSDFTGIKDWQAQILSFARENGFAETLSGRKRWLSDILAGNPKYRTMAERMAVNFPIQGLAADIIKKAMISVSRYLEEKKLEEKIKMILQIHDELVFEVNENIAELAEKEIEKIMESAFALDQVDLKADSKIGKDLSFT